jgi:hypothetical protein
MFGVFFTRAGCNFASYAQYTISLAISYCFAFELHYNNTF